MANQVTGNAWRRRLQRHGRFVISPSRQIRSIQKTHFSRRWCRCWIQVTFKSPHKLQKSKTKQKITFFCNLFFTFCTYEKLMLCFFLFSGLHTTRHLAVEKSLTVLCSRNKWVSRSSGQVWRTKESSASRHNF